MRKVVHIIALFVMAFSFSQEKEIYNDLASDFMTYYNQGDYEAIYNSFNPDMQKALPLEKTKLFLGDLKLKLGNISSIEFIKLKNNIAHVYKTTFDSEIRDILFYLDADNKIGGMLVSAHKPNNIAVIERNKTKMILPFKDEWFVFWGGTSIEQNYHMAHEEQKYAYDLLMVKDGASYKGDPKNNENYYVFGKDIVAPCDAQVAKVITGVEDNVPGVLNPDQLTGNTIVLKTKNEEFLLFAHLKKNSILVKEGQKVKQGQVIAKCGNSGNTSEPHLHLSLQNAIDMEVSTGGKIYFEKILVNGEVREDYLPVKEDFIKNIN